MPRSFDLILADATVVNQDGVGMRDIGVIDGKIAEIGDLGGRFGGRARRLPRPAYPARRDRQPGAFPRAGPDPQGGPGDRLARGGAGRRHRRVRNAQHRSADDVRRGARRQGRARRRGACIAISPSGSAARTTTSPIFRELERLPGAAGIKVFMGSSTGTLLVADDAGVLAILKATRRRAAFHSEDEARLDERKGLRVAGDPVFAPGLARRDRRAALHRAADPPRARGARAGACAAYLDPRGDRVAAERQGRRELRGDAASPDAERRGLRAARNQVADEPAGARARAPRRRSGAASPRASSTCSAPTTRRIRWRRRPSPIPKAPRA